MARKRKPLPLLEGVTIIDEAAEGKALAKVNDMVVFVPFAAPGDVVDVQLTHKKHNYAEGFITNFQKYSDLRVTPFCEHFGVCGGCKWQHIPYEEQLRFKQKQVVDSLTRIGKVQIGEVHPIIGSEKTQFYRNKLEFTFSNCKWLKDKPTENTPTEDMNALGFHIPGMFDKVLDIHKCWLQDDISNQIRLDVKSYCLQHEGYSFFDIRQKSGLMRNLMIRTASTGEVMAVVSFAEENETLRNELLNHIKETFPQITSLMYVINAKLNDTINDLDVHLFSGKDHIIEEMEGLQFKVGPKSFYQTNTEQAYNLYKTVREFAGLQPEELVYDLYTGTGTIANFIARNVKQVIGIEYVPEAIADAKVNSNINHIQNTAFIAGDMKDILVESFIRQHGRPDVIITDPPRAGMHEDVIRTILFAAPKRIVYVSCNPATQARDLNLLSPRYEVRAIQPVDMFPHTQHVENVAQLFLKEEREISTGRENISEK